MDFGSFMADRQSRANSSCSFEVAADNNRVTSKAWMTSSKGESGLIRKRFLIFFTVFSTDWE